MEWRRFRVGKDWAWGEKGLRTGLTDAELVVRLEELEELETVDIVPELSERLCAGILGDLRPVGVGPSGLQVGECDG